MPRGRPRTKLQATDIVPFVQKAIVRNMGYSVLSDNVTYNPDNITLSTYDEMRNHPTIAGGLDVIKLPIISLDWFIDSSDERKKKFIEKNLRDLWGSFIRDCLLGYDFGFAPFEKVLGLNSDNMVIVKKMIALSVHYVKIKRTPELSFDGLVLEEGGYKPAVIDRDKCFVFTYKKEFENFYGKPRCRGAYTAWYIHRYILEFCNKFYDKYGTPTLLGYAPSVKTKFQGKDVDATDMMLDILKSIQNASAVVLPHTGGKLDELKYQIKVLESQRTGGDFLAYLKYLDNLMFTGSGIPPLTYSAGDKGSYDLFESQSQLFAQGVDGDITMIKRHIDQYFIKPLIKMNFGDSEKDDTRFVYQSLANRDQELTRQVMLALVQQGKLDIATKYLIDALGMPALEAGKLLEEAKKEVQPVEKLPPKPQPEAKFSRKKFRREPNQMEKHIDFERIQENYDKNEEDVYMSLVPILTKQKIQFMDNLEKAIKDKNINQIKDIDISFRSEYEKKIIELSKKIYADGFEDVMGELKKRLSMTNEGKSWVVTSSQNIAQKHLNDLKFTVISTALYGISKELSEKQVMFEAIKKWDGYVETKLADSSLMMVQKFYNEGRDWAGDLAGAKFAEWSAVLDEATCPYCEGRDGMVIELDNPDISEFSPGNVHERCRCIWIYLNENELPEKYSAWRTPSKADQNKYYTE